MATENRNHGRRTVTFGALTATLPAVVPASAEDWGSLGLDGGRSRQSIERSGFKFIAGWKNQMPAGKESVYRNLLASPAVADGYLVIGTQRNGVRALREIDGRVLWDFQAKDAIHATPALWRGRAYIVGLDQTLYALRLVDGGLSWKRDLGGIGYASPTVVDGSLFVATGHPTPQVMRVDAVTGALLWKTGPGLLRQAAFASLAVGEGQVLVGATIASRWRTGRGAGRRPPAVW